jgi:hypothetical protein
MFQSPVPVANLFQSDFELEQLTGTHTYPYSDSRSLKSVPVFQLSLTFLYNILFFFFSSSYISSFYFLTLIRYKPPNQLEHWNKSKVILLTYIKLCVPVVFQEIESSLKVNLLSQQCSSVPVADVPVSLPSGTLEQNITSRGTLPIFKLVLYVFLVFSCNLANFLY